MKIDTDLLKKVSNYARLVGQSTQNIYTLIQKGRLTAVEIDGIKFVVIKK